MKRIETTGGSRLQFLGKYGYMKEKRGKYLPYVLFVPGDSKEKQEKDHHYITFIPVTLTVYRKQRKGRERKTIHIYH